MTSHYVSKFLERGLREKHITIFGLLQHARQIDPNVSTAAPSMLRCLMGPPLDTWLSMHERNPADRFLEMGSPVGQASELSVLLRFLIIAHAHRSACAVMASIKAVGEQGFGVETDNIVSPHHSSIRASVSRDHSTRKSIARLFGLRSMSMSREGISSGSPHTMKMPTCCLLFST